MIAAERLALRREEHGHIVRLDGELRTALFDVFAQPCDGSRADGDITLLVALAVSTFIPCAASSTSDGFHGWRGRFCQGFSAAMERPMALRRLRGPPSASTGQPHAAKPPLDGPVPQAE